MQKIFESIPHTADIHIRVYGKTIEELFRNALKGMFLSIGPIIGQQTICLNTIPYLDQEHEIFINAQSIQLLLVDFLSEALYLSDVHNEAYFDAQFAEFTQSRIIATVRGHKVDSFEVVEIKAVTYHGLKVEKKDNEWIAEIVFDI